VVVAGMRVLLTDGCAALIMSIMGVMICMRGHRDCL